MWQQVEMKASCSDRNYHATHGARRQTRKQKTKQQQITERLQKPIVTQGLTAGAYISLSGINAHKDSNTTISVIFQTKDHSIERTVLIIVTITCALSNFSRNNQFKWRWQLLDIKHTCCNLNWISREVSNRFSCLIWLDLS